MTYRKQPRDPEAPRRIMSVRIDEETFSRLRRVAWGKGISVSATVNVALRRFLGRVEADGAPLDREGTR